MRLADLDLPDGACLSDGPRSSADLRLVQMLVGIVAINVLDVIPLDDDRALGVLLVGYVFQGSYCDRARASHGVPKAHC